MTLRGHRDYVERATERLYGIMQGITADYELNDVEIAKLRSWLDTHEMLCQIEPFKEVAAFLDRCFEDQIIDEDERVEIIEFCTDLVDNATDCL